VDVLVETILSQNTSDTNSTAGHKQLRRRFTSWNQVADAPVDEVERHIRVAGLSKQKAPRIQSILREIREKHRKIDLQFLHEYTDEQAFDFLRAFKGVGPKTANCVLLFAFGKKLFPVDTHIHRIAIRLGLIPSNATAEQAHDLLKPMIPPEHRYGLHLLLIEHGRKICRAVSPKCEDCALQRFCAFKSATRAV
jgi:endonuclease-3